MDVSNAKNSNSYSFINLKTSKTNANELKNIGAEVVYQHDNYVLVHLIDFNVGKLLEQSCWRSYMVFSFKAKLF